MEDHWKKRRISEVKNVVDALLSDGTPDQRACQHDLASRSHAARCQYVLHEQIGEVDKLVLEERLNDAVVPARSIFRQYLM
jgi:hypothetical protein